MARSQSELLQGTLDLLILKSLALEQMHGMGISRRIGQITNGRFEVKAGSLFPALHRMDEAGWLTSSWGQSETNRRAAVPVDGGGEEADPRGSAAMGAHFHCDGERFTLRAT